MEEHEEEEDEVEDMKSIENISAFIDSICIFSVL